MPICSRPSCNRFFAEETRAFRGELIHVRSCVACRATKAEYMRRFRATDEGHAKKQIENASKAAIECYRRYNASVKGKQRTIRQGEERIQQTQKRFAMGDRAA
jgi:hypothetical protein